MMLLLLLLFCFPLSVVILIDRSVSSVNYMCQSLMFRWMHFYMHYVEVFSIHWSSRNEKWKLRIIDCLSFLAITCLSCRLCHTKCTSHLFLFQWAIVTYHYLVSLPFISWWCCCCCCFFSTLLFFFFFFVDHFERFRLHSLVHYLSFSGSWHPFEIVYNSYAHFYENSFQNIWVNELSILIWNGE